MNKYLILFGTIFCSICVWGQTSTNWSLRSGTGYFGDIGAKMFGSTGDFEGFNPRFYETHHGSAVFLELSYLLENNYSVGFKIFKAETKLPYNDIDLRRFLYNANSIATVNGIEINILYNLKYKRHHHALGCGPVLHISKDSQFRGIYADFLTDESGNEFGLLYLGEYLIHERSEIELGVNPNITYEFMLNKSIGIGLKTEAYLMAYYGWTYFTIYPTIVFKI